MFPLLRVEHIELPTKLLDCFLQSNTYNTYIALDCIVHMYIDMYTVNIWEHAMPSKWVPPNALDSKFKHTHKYIEMNARTRKHRNTETQKHTRHTKKLVSFNTTLFPSVSVTIRPSPLHVLIEAVWMRGGNLQSDTTYKYSQVSDIHYPPHLNRHTNNTN